MKKFLLFVTTFLVLVSSIVFCGCKDKYDDLKIECNVSELNLVLDDNELKYKNMIFELSGSKEWGEVSIVSKPDGLFRVVDSIIDGKRYGVRIQALQPTGTGAYLEFTHLGSGKTCSVPLYIGRRLQEVSSKGNEFIVQLPEFKDGEETKAVEILTEDLLQCLPENYTDDIVWQASTNTLPYGVKVDSYDETGNITNAFGLTAGSIGPNFDGTSNAKKSVITLKRGVGACEFNISPISVLENGKAVYYSDVIVKVKLMNVLSSDNVIATSLTHSERMDEEDIPGSELLKELVLISNPHTVRGESVTGYNNYNTGLVELKVQQGDQLVEFDNEAFRDFVWDELYDI